MSEVPGGAPGALEPPGRRRILVPIAMTAALFGIGRTTGSGWMIVICSGVSAVLVVAAAWPLLALRGLSLDASAPRDGTVGRPLPLFLRVRARGRRRALLLGPVDPDGPWTRAAAPSEGEVCVVPLRRGILSAVAVEVRCAAPLGLVTWRRRITASLGMPVEVGPVPVEVALPAALLGGAPGGDPRPHSRVGSDVVRGVRDYQPGDSARLVHWPATARRGELMVKELDEPERPQVAIVVDLRGAADLAEDAASRAAGLVGVALRGGTPVLMLIAERAGGVVAAVGTARAAGRRLARAVALAPPEGPLPLNCVVLRVTAKDAA